MSENIVMLSPGKIDVSPQAQIRARITILSQLYHSTPGEPVSGPSPIRTYRWLDSDEQGYTRSVKIGEDWQEIDLGWLKDKDIGYIFFENDTRRLPGKVPTQEELDELAAKVIEIGIVIQVATNDFEIHPLMSFLPEEGTGFCPIALQNLRVRCRKGVAKLSYYVVPA